MARYNTTSDIKRMWKNVRLFTAIFGTVLNIGLIILVVFTKSPEEGWIILLPTLFFGIMFFIPIYIMAASFLINLDRGERKISEFPMEYREKKTRFLKLDYLSTHGMGGLNYYRDVMKKMAIEDSADDSK